MDQKVNGNTHKIHVRKVLHVKKITSRYEVILNKKLIHPELNDKRTWRRLQIKLPFLELLRNRV